MSWSERLTQLDEEARNVALGIYDKWNTGKEMMGLTLEHAAQTIGEDAQTVAKYLNDPRNAWIGMNPLGRTVSEGLGLTTALLGKIVYHGSPYKFNKFIFTKIGTGEGAQAFGHGLYMAENPAVAKNYLQPSMRHMQEITAINKKLSETATIIDAEKIPGGHNTFRSSVGKQAAAYYDQLLEQRSKLLQQSGHLYTVDLPDESIAKMLDWDKPFTEQPQNVQDAILAIWPKKRLRGWGESAQELPIESPVGMTGAQIYARLSGHGKDAISGSSSGVGMVEASEQLKQLGIPGIKYLDQGSRSAGKGTYNYVVFDENLPTIMKRE